MGSAASNRGVVWGVTLGVLIALATGCSGTGDSPDPTADGSSTTSDVAPGTDDGAGDHGSDESFDGDSGGDSDDGSEGASDDGSEGGDDGGDGGGQTTTQTTVLKSLPGAARGCVATAGKRDVRSGDFGAGPFDDATATFRKQSRSGQPATVRLYFIPRTGGSPLPGLQLTVVNTATGDQQTVEQKTTSDAEQWTFYDVQVPITAPGTYRLQARSGDDTGCFRVTFR